MIPTTDEVDGAALNIINCLFIKHQEKESVSNKRRFKYIREI